MSQNAITNSLRIKLTNEGTRCNDGTTEASILEFENAFDVRFPDDFRMYLKELNGTCGEYANGIIRFWSLDEICSVQLDFESKKQSSGLIQSAYQSSPNDSNAYYLFADHMYESQLYAIKLKNVITQNSIVMFDGGPRIEIADSFSNFLAMYMTEPESLRLATD